jgi:hypothetical protein
MRLRDRDYASVSTVPDVRNPAMDAHLRSPPAALASGNAVMTARLDGMESRGLIELRFPDGRKVTAEYETVTRVQLQRGERLDYEGTGWVMRDREDREGVTVYVFTPVRENESVVERPRARLRRGGLR